MQVTAFGVNSQKDVVPTELTVQQVAQAGINPFRIDLCDQQPLMLDVSQGKLAFHRLNDIAFAVRNRAQGNVQIVIREGNRAVKISGKATDGPTVRPPAQMMLR